MATKKKTTTKAPTATKAPVISDFPFSSEYTGYEMPTPAPVYDQGETGVFVPGYTNLPGVNEPVTPATLNKPTTLNVGPNNPPVVIPASTTTTQDQTVTPQDNSARQSAYDLLYDKFARLGLGGLVSPLQDLIKRADIQPSQITTELRNSKAYQQRFAANAQRQSKGLMPLDEATYISNENQYEKIMKNYGLPVSYYAGTTDPQTGITYKPSLEKFLVGDISPTELEDRITTAQQRVLNTNPEVLKALKQFYPDISNADILAYTLDPEQSLNTIKRKVSAAEIGGAALAQGLSTGQASAEALAGMGITKQQAQQGYQTIGEMLPRATQLGSIYNTPYDQATAEAETFGTAGAAEAARKRKALAALEVGSFSGSSGVGALGRDTAPYRQQTYGAGQY